MPDRATGLRFDPEWRISLATALLLPFLIFLGFWQLQRADDKAALAASWEQKRHQAPLLVSALGSRAGPDLAYVPVALSGSFIAGKHFLLDNRIHRGRFGYEVLALFQLSGPGLTVLVNRGWVAGDAARLSLPTVPSVAGEVEISGYVYVAPGSPYLLAEQELGSGWPQRIQAVEMAKLSPLIAAETGAEVFPYPIRIDRDEPGALTVDWQIVNVSPQKHTGYAVQWFAMAAVLGIYYVVRSSNLVQLLSSSTRKHP